MKVVLLAGANSIHTIQWANGLAQAGCKVHLISRHPLKYDLSKDVEISIIPVRGIIGYYLMVGKVKEILRKIKPDILNTHYVSGYGTTARLANFHPWILSAWGSDIFDFPFRSPFHKWIIGRNLASATRVASTSICMAKKIQTLVPRSLDISITPFGVDLEFFSGINFPRPVVRPNLVIGTVKSMEYLYGIDILIKAFALVRKKFDSELSNYHPSIQLRLVGGGAQIDKFKSLAADLGVGNLVHFVGEVPHEHVPYELSLMDIYVALSRQESFGVAVIEASSMSIPVIVSDVGGLPEVVVNYVTGIIVPAEDIKSAAVAIETLSKNPILRQKMGSAGRKFVDENYSWRSCISKMLRLYEETIDITE